MRELLRGDDADRVYYQVRDPQGRLLGGDRELRWPDGDEPPVLGTVRLRDTDMRGEPVRVAFVWIDPAPAEPPAAPAAVDGLPPDTLDARRAARPTCATRC